MLQQAKEEIARSLMEVAGVGYEAALASLETSKGGFGDISSRIAFSLAKEKGENPAKIATQISQAIKPSGYMEKALAAGPYLNFILSNSFYRDAVNAINKKKAKFGQGKPTGKKIALEYFHANTHKGVHIGHIRNVSIGEAIARITEAAGNKVIRMNYQGDIGPHVAKCLWGYINLYGGKAPEIDRAGRSASGLGVWLGKVYSEASKKTKGVPELEAQVQEINKKLYSGDKGMRELWQETRQWCLDDFEHFYKEFGVRFDELYFESMSEKPGKEVALELLEKGVAVRDQGAVIMDFKEEGMGVFILLTGEGYPLYSAKDLGLAKIKFKKYSPDRSIHVVGKEQELYFKQLFRTFEKAASIDNELAKAAKASYHLIYALVMLPEGKMSSRDGTMVLYEDLRDKMLDIVRGEVRKRHTEWDETTVDSIALKIALAAIKFSMTRRESNKVMVFDWDQALSLEGDSGPYVQYAHVRTAGILAKAEEKPGTSAKYIFSPEEKKLIRKLCELPDLVQKSAKDMTPHYISEFSLDVATDFNKFYATSSVLGAETKEAKKTRLAIVQATSTVLKNSLELIGIGCPEKM